MLSEKVRKVGVAHFCARKIMSNLMYISSKTYFDNSAIFIAMLTEISLLK